MVAPETRPNRPASWLTVLTFKSLMAKPRPSSAPVKLTPLLPMGLKPSATPPFRFQFAVVLASMSFISVQADARYCDDDPMPCKPYTSLIW